MTGNTLQFDINGTPPTSAELARRELPLRERQRILRRLAIVSLIGFFATLPYGLYAGIGSVIMGWFPFPKTVWPIQLFDVFFITTVPLCAFGFYRPWEVLEPLSQYWDKREREPLGAAVLGAVVQNDAIRQYHEAVVAQGRELTLGEAREIQRVAQSETPLQSCERLKRTVPVVFH